MATEIYRLDNNVFEVIGLLEVGRKNYPRLIARELKLSHTFVNNILSRLYKERILERIKTGRTHQYTLRKTYQTKKMLIMVKCFQIMKIMKQSPAFRFIMEEINEKINGVVNDIDCILLFGSYATGDYKKDSDVDLFFITDLNEKVIKKKLEIVNLKYDVKTNAKFLSKKEFLNKKEDLLIKEVLEKGIPIYNAEEFYDIKWMS